VQGRGQGEGGAQRGGLSAIRGAQGGALPRAAEPRPVARAPQVRRRLRGRHQRADQVSAPTLFEYGCVDSVFSFVCLDYNIWTGQQPVIRLVTNFSKFTCLPLPLESLIGMDATR
jgi:hypothetical protein